MKKLLCGLVLISVLVTQSMFTLSAEDNVFLQSETALPNGLDLSNLNSNNPPIYETKIPDELVPLGWKQRAVVHKDTGQVLYWTLENMRMRSVTDEVYINLSEVNSNGPGYTYVSGVITLTGSYSYILLGSTTLL